MAKLTIQDVAAVLIEKSGLSQKQANKFAMEMFSLIIEKLQDGEQVKVKGFGTFKVMSVESRESVNVRTGERILIEGHDKVTFTPDTLIKELVNKPFSQFETVVLNEGVVFDDEQDGNNEVDRVEEEEEKLPLEERPLVTYVDEENEKEDIQETPKIDDIHDAQEILNIESSSESDVHVEDPGVTNMIPEENEQQHSPVPESENIEEKIDEEIEHTPWLKWILTIGVVVILMLVSAYGGYEYAMNKVEPVLKLYEISVLEKENKIVKSDTPITAKDSVVLSEPMVESQPLTAAKPVVDVEPLEGMKPVEKIKSVEKANNKTTDEVENRTPEVVKQVISSPIDPYAAKDERVRLGAYRIVGTLNVVTVQPGQTFYSICRGNLGPDMECYVEVYNDFPRRPQIKVGQKIKIPKLELKKKRKR